MRILDDDGNIFGVVNVVDALAIFLVLAVVGAGAALVVQSDDAPASPETDTVNATLDLGEQPAYLARALNEGDTYAADGTSELTVTDVHVTPAGDGRMQVLLRVQLEAHATDESIEYAGAPPRLGRQLTVETDRYTVEGAIRDLGGDDALRTTTTEVLLSRTMPASEARELSVGDTYRVAGRDVATVESVRSYATANPDERRVFVGLSLRTLAADGHARFAGSAVREGSTLEFETPAGALGGTVERVGATDLRGTQTTRTVTLTLRNVGPELADGIAAGMTETTSGETVAEVTAVERENSTVVLRSDDGNIYERPHPVNQDLTLTVDLTVRETANGVTFKGRTIQQGSEITLDLGSVTVSFTVASL